MAHCHKGRSIDAAGSDGSVAVNFLFYSFHQSHPYYIPIYLLNYLHQQKRDFTVSLFHCRRLDAPVFAAVRVNGVLVRSR